MAQRSKDFQRADAIVLTYARERPETLHSLTSYWLPELLRLEVNVPVVVAGCKSDLRDDPQVSLEHLSPIMEEFQEIQSCIECSALTLSQVRKVFYHALIGVLNPMMKLIDPEKQTLRPECVKALTRIFKLSDHDSDGALCNAELNEFEVKCFDCPFRSSEISGVKKLLEKNMPEGEGVNERGLTLRGFLFLQTNFLGKGDLETTWRILRRFGYNNDIRLVDEFLPPSFKRAPDKRVELSNLALEFLIEIFGKHDIDNDGVLCPFELEGLFSTAPDCPWTGSPYTTAVSTNALGGLTLHGFLSQWTLMTLLEPARSVEYLKYVLYGGDATSAIRLTKRTSVDRKSHERNVYQCFVFSPKSALFDNVLGRTFSNACDQNTEQLYAVTVVDEIEGSPKFLVLQEIPEAKVTDLVSDKESLAACDVALFLWDSIDESSLKKTAELLEEVAVHGKDTGYEVPSLLVCAKPVREKLKSIADADRVCKDMGITDPLFMTNGNPILERILMIAENPHLSIPKKKARKSPKLYLRVMAVAVAIAVVAANRVFAARRNGSS